MADIDHKKRQHIVRSGLTKLTTKVTDTTSSEQHKSKATCELPFQPVS